MLPPVRFDDRRFVREERSVATTIGAVPLGWEGVERGSRHDALRRDARALVIDIVAASTHELLVSFSLHDRRSRTRGRPFACRDVVADTDHTRLTSQEIDAEILVPESSAECRGLGAR